MEKFSNKLALFTSYIFHPLFMPTNGLLITYFLGKVPGFNIYSTEEDKANAHFTLWCVFFATGILPVIIAIILKKLKVVSSLHMPKREERVIPFLLTSICYAGVYYFLKSYIQLPISHFIYFFIHAGLLATIVGFMVTFSWKISVHMIGIGGVVGIITVLSTISDVLLAPLILAIIASGLIAFGRLQLNAHSAPQILAGFLLGFSCEVLGIIMT